MISRYTRNTVRLSKSAIVENKHPKENESCFVLVRAGMTAAVGVRFSEGPKHPGRKPMDFDGISLL